MTNTFTLSIEETTGVRQYPFHLGTIESIARQCAEERFHALVQYGFPVVTVALMQAGRMVDCFDGRWSSEYSN